MSAATAHRASCISGYTVTVGRESEVSEKPSLSTSEMLLHKMSGALETLVDKGKLSPQTMAKVLDLNGQTPTAFQADYIIEVACHGIQGLLNQQELSHYLRSPVEKQHANMIEINDAIDLKEYFYSRANRFEEGTQTLSLNARLDLHIPNSVPGYGLWDTLAHLQSKCDGYARTIVVPRPEMSKEEAPSTETQVAKEQAVSAS